MKFHDEQLYIADGAIHHVSDMLDKNVVTGDFLYVSGPTVNRLYGAEVKKQLSEVGHFRELIIDHNTIDYSMKVAEEVIATDVDAIVAMGGGKVLDVSKYAAFISKVPLLSIPTTAANDGMASPIAVLKRRDNRQKSLGAASPDMLLVDTSIIAKGPQKLIQAGIGDTISNYLALQDWKFACDRGKDRMNGYAYIMSQTSLDALLRTEYREICPEFIRVLINSLVLSGIAMVFAGSSRPVSGSEHLFSHAIDYYAPQLHNLHGQQVALGTIAVLKLLGKPYDVPLQYLEKFRVPIHPECLHIDKDLFILCMQKGTSMRKGRYTYLAEADLSEEKLSRLYDDLVKEL